MMMLRVQEHCVLAQQYTKQKETVRMFNMVQNAIVTVSLTACHQVRIGSIPDVGVSVTTEQQNTPNPYQPDAKRHPFQK